MSYRREKRECQHCGDITYGDSCSDCHAEIVYGKIYNPKIEPAWGWRTPDKIATEEAAAEKVKEDLIEAVCQAAYEDAIAA